MKWISRLYIFFLGIILSITTGFGVAAFYPQPTAPAYPSTPYAKIVPQSCNATPEAQSSIECQKILTQQQTSQQEDEIKRQKYDQDSKIYQEKNASYTRTAIFFGIVIGALFAIVGLGLIKKSKLIATGLLLAGVLTAILTRLLIGLASLGSSVNTTSGADTIAYVEFGILFILSIAVVGVGLFTLKDHEPTDLPSPQPQPHTLNIN